jgi:hypothetical protein
MAQDALRAARMRDEGGRKNQEEFFYSSFILHPSAFIL